MVNAGTAEIVMPEAEPLPPPWQPAQVPSLGAPVCDTIPVLWAFFEIKAVETHRHIKQTKVIIPDFFIKQRTLKALI